MSQLTICLIIFALTIFSYLWGKLSLATTALCSALLFYVTGCIDQAVVSSSLGNVNGIVMLSMFIVGAGFNKTQLVKNISNGIVRIAKGSLTKVLAGYILCGALLCSLVNSNLVPFCILFPLLTNTVEDMGISPSKVMFSLGLTVICCLGIIPLGGAAATYAQQNALLAANGYTEHAMVVTDMLKGRWPVLVFTVLYAIFVAPRLAPDKPPVAIKSMDNTVADKALSKPAMSPFHERCGYLIFFGVSVLLLFSAKLKIPAWEITLIGALLMVITGVLSTKEAVAAMPIGVWLLFVGSLCLASALTNTGAGALMGGAIAKIAESAHSNFVAYALFFIAPFILTQFMFNQTIATIFTPIIIQTCISLGVSPIGPLVCCYAAALTAFMSPMATGTVPYYMAAGGYDMRSVMKQSWLPAICIALIQITWLSIAFPLF